MHEIFLNAERLFYFGGFPLTNAFLLTCIVVAILAIGSVLISKRLMLVPGGAQNIVELGVESFLGLMESIFGSRREAENYFPFVATIFVFVLFSNWFGILPGVGSVGFFNASHSEFIPLLRSPASDLNFTLALAATTVIATHVFGIRALGVGAHASKFFNFSSPVNFFIGILEFVSEIAKIISFSFRLFGNVFAGEVLLLVIAFLVPYAAPLPFLFLELFVGFIQAFVFAMLATVFTAVAITGHGEHDEAHGKGH